MIAYVSGNITFKSPAYVIIESAGLGYQVNISLGTYSKIQSLSACKLHTYFAVREDAQVLYGFYDIEEKEMFVMLISVSGVGPSTAMMIFSLPLKIFKIPPIENDWNGTACSHLS